MKKKSVSFHYFSHLSCLGEHFSLLFSLFFFFFLPMSGTLMLYQPSLFFETGTYYIAQG